MRNCKRDSEIMRNYDWRTRYAGTCYFYPARDCPGWETSGTCGRVGRLIPEQPEGERTVTVIFYDICGAEMSTVHFEPGQAVVQVPMGALTMKVFLDTGSPV